MIFLQNGLAPCRTMVGLLIRRAQDKRAARRHNGKVAAPSSLRVRYSLGPAEEINLVKTESGAVARSAHGGPKPEKPERRLSQATRMRTAWVLSVLRPLAGLAAPQRDAPGWDALAKDRELESDHRGLAILSPMPVHLVLALWPGPFGARPACAAGGGRQCCEDGL